MGRYILKITGRYLALIITLALLWLFLSGYYTKPTLLVFGVISILLTVYLTERAGMLDREGVPVHIFPGIIGYMLWLTVEIGKANVLVLQHALSPELKLSPKMVKVPAAQTSDLGKMVFANSITLTPGTVSVDLHNDEILVHTLTEELADPAPMIEMGERVRGFDGLEGREWYRKRREARKNGEEDKV